MLCIDCESDIKIYYYYMLYDTTYTTANQSLLTLVLEDDLTFHLKKTVPFKKLDRLPVLRT